MDKMDKIIERFQAVQDHGLATPEENSILNYLKELKKARETIKTLENKLAESFSIKDAMDEATLTDWYINSVSDENEPVWTEKHISELYNDYFLFPKQVSMHSGDKYEMEFWSNSCGELFDQDGNYIEEAYLPEELNKAYEGIWTDSYASSCHLVKYKGNYGVALINEYDDETSNNLYGVVDMNRLYNDFVLPKAQKFSSTPLLLAANASIEVGNKTGVAGCHELIIFVPWNTDRSLFKKLCRYVDANAY